MDCTGASTPGGSLFGWAYDYALKQGLEMETSYPATAQPSRCHYKKTCVAVTFDSIRGANSTSPLKGNETALAQALHTSPITAVLAVGIDFERYTHGILASCGEQTMGNLAVEVVGYGVSAQGKAFWTVKAPWGEQFGDKGFVQIAKDAGNACGIADTWAYPVGVKYTPAPALC